MHSVNNRGYITKRALEERFMVTNMENFTEYGYEIKDLGVIL